MKQRHLLAVGPWYPATAFNYFIEAFERLGWIVTRCGPTYFDHGKEYNVKWDEELLPKIDIEIARGMDWNIDHLIDYTCHKWQTENAVDLVFICEENYQNEIHNTKKVPSVLWSADGWPNSYARKDMIQATASFTNHALGIAIHPLEETPAGWGVMVGAAAPWVHKYFGKFPEDREVDFALHATPYGCRAPMCQALRESGLRVTDGIVGTRQYVESYNNAKFTYHNSGGQSEIKWRAFEGAASGCIQIMDHMKLLPDFGFLPMVNYIPIDIEKKADGSLWPNYQNLARIIKESSREVWLPNMARLAREHVLCNHTYYNRYLQICQAVGIDPGFSLEELQMRSFRENDAYPVG